MKTIIILQARMGSHRLPGKSLMPVWKDMSLLELVLARITRARLPDRVVLATTRESRDDPLVGIAEKYGVAVVRGSEDDVLGRFVQALDAYPADAVVRACADNPLLDPVMIDNLVTFFRDVQPCDYAMNLGPMTGFPDGVGVEMVSAAALRRVDRETRDPSHREHVLTYIHDNPSFVSKWLYADDAHARPGYRLDIDFPEDMHFVRELVRLLPEASAPHWSTEEIIRTVDEHTDLLKLRKVRT
ncbi:MAG: NTP transferase domain-containing protein [Methanomicrobiales archaeon]|nr:NTP transferase domain-containing protein [Methanomicrobiales archaeon]